MIGAGRDGVLGRCVFGTQRGLVAEGDGWLAGAALDSSAFELRGSAGEALLPDNGSTRLLRLPMRVASGDPFDLLASAVYALDADSRPGFIACGVAVPLADPDGYRRAYEELHAAFGAMTAACLEDGRFRTAPRPRLGSPAREAGAVRVQRIGRGREPVLLTLTDWWERSELLLDALAACAAAQGRDAGVIAVSDRGGRGWQRIDGDLVDGFADLAAGHACEDRDPSAEDARRSAAGATRNASDGTPADPATRREIADLRRRVESLEARLRLEAGGGRIFARRTHDPADAPARGRGRINFDPVFGAMETGFLERHRTALIAALAVLGLLMILLFGVLALFGSGSAAEMPAGTPGERQDG